MARLAAISPHLGDAVLSCGGTLARHVAQGYEVVLVTVCSGGDALAPRRAADQAAADALDCLGAVHLGLEPAELRGYVDLAAFHGLREDDEAPAVARGVLAVALARLAPDLVLAPIGLGGHVDQELTNRALDALGLPRLRWVDLPYALGRTAGAPLGAGEPVVVPIAEQLDAKLAAAEHYDRGIGPRLAAYASAEGERLGADGPVELLLSPPAQGAGGGLTLGDATRP